MRYTSIFCLKRFKEKGGPANAPAMITDNPQGGFFVQWLERTMRKSKPKKQREKSGAGWGLGGPSLVQANPQGGILFFPIFGANFKQIGEKGGGKKGEKPKSPKPVRPHKGKPAHAKLHANPHPILAETLQKMRGSFLKREVDSASMYPAVTAKGVKRESQFKIASACFRESAMPVTGALPTRFRVVLIEEGMGNSTDAFYYTKDALESAADVFTGLKIMVDHPSESEEVDRPERSTRDVIGHYENLAVEIAPDGQAQLCADIDILDVPDTELARAQMVRATENAAKFPGRDFIGLSINASGPSQETPIADVITAAPQGAKQKLVDAQSEGIETVRVVTKINRAVSCDLVTEAGAGGKILNIIGESSDG